MMLGAARFRVLRIAVLASLIAGACDNTGTGEQILVRSGHLEGESLPVLVSVVDTDGVAQANLSARAFRSDGAVFESSGTDANGEAVVSVPPGTYRFATQIGNHRIFGPECVVPGCAATQIVVDRIDVSVVDGNGAPLSGVWVLVWPQAEETFWLPGTDATGHGEVGVAPGTYRFSTDAYGARFWSGECVVPGCRSVQLMLAKVDVTVVDQNGSPLAGLWVSGVDAAGDAKDQGYTNEAGVAEIGLPAGAYRFHVKYGGIDFWSSETLDCAVPGCSARQIVVATGGGSGGSGGGGTGGTGTGGSGGTATGGSGGTTTYQVLARIVDTDGVPQPNLSARAFSSTGEVFGYSGTDVNGEAVVMVPAGTYRFATEISDHRIFGPECVVPGCATTEIVIDRIDVSVVDGNGAPLTNTGVLVWPEGKETFWAPSLDAAGHTVVGVEPGTYRFSTDAYGGRFWSAECVVPGCRSVQLMAARVTVSVVDELGTPIPGVWVTGKNSLDEGIDQGTTDENGVAELGLQAGITYRFHVKVGGVEFYSADAPHCAVPGCSSGVIVVTGVTSDVPVAVVYPSGEPATLVAVHALDTEGRTVASGVTNYTGVATFRLISGRAYRFSASADGMSFYSGAPGHCAVPGCTSASIVLGYAAPCAGQADGTACSDGNACTQTDTCQAGACTGANPVACVAQDQCHVAGTCEPSTGVCTNPTVADGTTCSDGNACTQADTCQAGACAGGSPVTCVAQDQCHAAGTCDQATGTCSNPAAADGTACNDGNACTQADTCQAGACAGGSPVTCVAQDQCHAAGTCDPSTGTCSNPAVADGTNCNDGNACTQADTCQGGTCTGTTPVVCTASDQCHQAGTCDPATGTCTNPAVADGTACNDGNACTQTDTCQAGACAGGNQVTCVAQDQCHTAGTCDPSTGACSNPAAADGTACNDGNACTQADTCQAGACAGGSPVTCVAQDQCHAAGTCDPSTGTCSNPAAADGTNCNDGNACTQADTCQGGTCTGATPVVCTASDQCHQAGTCDPATGTCTNPAVADGTACSDGNACTQTDTCQAGACAGGNPVTCVAQDQCHAAGTCEPATGACSNPVAPNGTGCDDGRSCTSGDACHEGVCTAADSACGVQLAAMNTIGKLKPSTTVTVLSDKAQIAGPEEVVFSTQVANTGTVMTVQGRLEIRNESTSPATVTRSDHEFGYRSRATGEWVTYAAAYSDCDSCFLTPVSGYSIYPYFDTLAVEAAGVTYSFWGLVGTVIGPGATATWDYTFEVLVAPGHLGLFRDPAVNDGIRKIFRIQTGGPTTETVSVDVSGAYAGMSADFTEPAGTITLGGMTMPMVPRSSAPVPPGGSVVLDVAPVMLGNAVPMRGDAEPEAAYTQRLHNLPCFYGRAEVSVSSNGETLWNGGAKWVCQGAPILSAEKLGPTGAQAGSVVEYNVSLRNLGREAAYGLDIQDGVEGLSVPITEPAPTRLDAGTLYQPAIATFKYVSSPAFVGPVTDVATVMWHDRNGNAYGPISSSFTTTFAAGDPQGRLELSAVSDAPDLVGTTKTLIVTAISPFLQPVASLPVHLTVAGPNPVSLAGVTGPDGTARFDIVGAALGTDRVVAAATITQTSIVSNELRVNWAEPAVGPCDRRTVPLDVVLVLDASGSMAAEGRIAAARAGARRFADLLDNNRDHVGGVAFGSTADTFELTTDFAAFKRWTDEFPLMGSTNIALALDAARAELSGPRRRPDATPVIVILSDGAATEGDTLAAIAALKATAIRTISFGLGSFVDGPLLRQIASSPKDYFYATSAEDIESVYAAIALSMCPFVRAGGDQGAYGVQLPYTLELNGEVHDDAPNGDVRFSSEWTLVSGPAPVTFADATSPVTNAFFVEPGTYVLQLAATDGSLTVSDRATVIVDPVPPTDGAQLTLVASGTGPVAVGATVGLTATLKTSTGAAFAYFPIEFRVTGAHPVAITVVTDASGVATYRYTGTIAGTDNVQATAHGSTTLLATVPAIEWTPAGAVGGMPQQVTQGWIGSPVHQATVTGLVPITLTANVSLASGSVEIWPMSDPDDIRVVAGAVQGETGDTIATLDTTTLANGPYVVRLSGTNTAGEQLTSLVALTVAGDYKPGRMTMDVTDFTVPLAGIPITLGRTYDSLDRHKTGDFGNGWSLGLSSLRLEKDPGHNVTMTEPGTGRRVTFRFTPQSIAMEVFFFLFTPAYTAEPGVHGTLTADGCPLLFFNYYLGGNPVCFIDSSLEYTPTTYRYTDPTGRVFTIASTGDLRSVKDLQGNTLTFAANGITSRVGNVSIPFVRDTAGRITRITDPSGRAYNYEYDGAGNLERMYAVFATGPTVTVVYEYNSDNLLTRSVDPRGNPERIATYDATGRLATITDAVGNRTSYAYDVVARRTTVTNPDGGQVTLVHDVRGLLLSETDPLGHTTSYEYDDARNLIAETNALGETTRHTYDARGNQTSTTDPLGRTTRMTYGQFGQPLTVVDALGRTTTITYGPDYTPIAFADPMGTIATFTSNANGQPLTATDALNATARFDYDEHGNRTSRTDRAGRVTRTLYDAMGRVTATIDPRGKEIRQAYDERGGLKEVSSGTAGQLQIAYERDAAGNVVREYHPGFGRDVRYTYDAANRRTGVSDEIAHTTRATTYDFRGKVLTETDEQGRVTIYTYDLGGRLTRVTYPDGTFVSHGYDALGRRTSTTDERGNSTTYEYDPGCGCDRATRVTDALGRSTVTRYDALGRRTAVIDAAGRETRFQYDARGRLFETNYPDGTREREEYDALGRRTAHIDQSDARTEYGYDAEGQLTTVADALGNVTRYGYDASGNQTTTTDANGHVTVQEYDDLNRLTRKTLPLGMTERYTYDRAGNRSSRLDANGRTTTYAYDSKNRVVGVTPDPVFGAAPVVFTYYPAGPRASMTDASGTTTYAYDDRDRLLNKATPQGTLSYTYDTAGNLASMQSSHENGVWVEYTWDAANQLTAVTDRRLDPGVASMSYTLPGRTDRVTTPNGVQMSYGYDGMDHVTSVTHTLGATSLASRAYAYAPTGHRLSVTAGTGRRVEYTYDAAKRLTGEAITGDPSAERNGTLGYTLDAFGNRLARTSTLAALGPQTFTYDANDRLTTDTYDSNGNTLASGGRTFTYDFDNRLVTADGGRIRLVYDGDGARVAKTVDGVTTQYLVDELNPTGYSQVVEEVRGGAVQRVYTYGTMLVSQRQVVGSAWATSFYGYDAHGNVTFLTDATGAVTDTYEYDAWGNLIASTGTTANPYLYDGQRWDAELGMYHLRARYYVPGRGRFTTVDPATGALVAPLSLNKYLYANADSVNLHDPLGLVAGVGYGGVGLAVAAAIATVPMTVQLGFDGQATPYRNSAVVVLGAAVNCAFLYAADWGADALRSAAGVPGDTAAYAAPFQHCAHKRDDRCDEVRKQCRKKCLSELETDRDLGGNWGYWKCLNQCYEDNGCL